ncbi:PRC-barrel domain containing protein [Streptomyces sp. NPDC058646]|uniref:PRC-barrel domain containing protein n=1 Tax=Streptomyces sp. NPDC058646 TaxID=3346574 RepID=UPI0036540266
MGSPIWAFADSSGHAPGMDLVGFKVEASDGAIGKIDKHSEDVDRSYVVVDTGPWIFGRRVMIPAGLITRVELQEEAVHLSCTRQQVKDSPDFGSGQTDDDVAAIRMIETHYSHPHM